MSKIYGENMNQLVKLVNELTKVNILFEVALHNDNSWIITIQGY